MTIKLHEGDGRDPRARMPGMFRFRMLLLLMAAALGVSCAGEPSRMEPAVDGDRAQGAVEKAVRGDDSLAALDLEMDRVWGEVLTRSGDNVDIEEVRAGQETWKRDRNQCSKSRDLQDCIAESYRTRIAELQARWRLVPFRGPFFFSGNENPADEVVATFFETDPPTAVLERGDRTVVVYRALSASGARYAGNGVTFWNKGNSARVTWEEGAGEGEYTLRPDPR